MSTLLPGCAATLPLQSRFRRRISVAGKLIIRDVCAVKVWHVPIVGAIVRRRLVEPDFLSGQWMMNKDISSLP